MILWIKIDFLNKKNNYSKYFDSIEGRARFRGETIGVDYAEAFVVVKKIQTGSHQPGHLLQTLAQILNYLIANNYYFFA